MRFFLYAVVFEIDQHLRMLMVPSCLSILGSVNFNHRNEGICQMPHGGEVAELGPEHRFSDYES